MTKKNEIKEAFENALLSALRPEADDKPLPVSVLEVARQYLKDNKSAADDEDADPVRGELKGMLADFHKQLPFAKTV